MKTKILVILAIVLFSATLKAQTDPLKSVTKMLGKSTGMGDIMGQVVNGIKPSSFTSGKAGKNDLIKQLSGIDATDYLKYASVAGELAGSLKGSSFLPGWADKKDGILDQLTKAGSIADVAGGMSGLLGNLSPSILSKGLKGNMGSITTALGLLSAIK